MQSSVVAFQRGEKVHSGSIVFFFFLTKTIKTSVSRHVTCSTQTETLRLRFKLLEEKDRLHHIAENTYTV